MATRFKSVIALLAAGVVVATAACSGDPPVPTPNIEATVEARVAQERAVDATVKAKSKVEASLQAPTTDTPTPAPRPTPLFTSAVNQSPQASPTQIPTATVVATSRLSPTHTPPPTPSPAEVARKLLDSGLIFMEEERFNEAITAYTEVIRLNPENAEAYHSRGAAYGYLDQFEYAIRDLDEAIRLNPDSAETYFYRAMANYSHGRFSLAVEDSSQAISLDPTRGEAYHVRASAFLALGDLREAHRNVRDAAKLGAEGAVVDTAQQIVDRLVVNQLAEFNRFLRACYNGEPRLAEFSLSYQQPFRRGVYDATGTRFGSYSDFIRRPLVWRFCEFKGVAPIINFFSDQGNETDFTSFLNHPHSGDIVRQELAKIICAFEAEPEITSLTGARFREFFGTPHQAVIAILQPSMLTVAPAIRDSFIAGSLNSWADKFAINPERYEGVEGILTVFREADKTYISECQ